jgi:hypothetical protein
MHALKQRIWARGPSKSVRKASAEPRICAKPVQGFRKRPSLPGSLRCHTARALGWVRRYLDEDRPTCVVEPDEGWLFLNEDGGHLGPSWLSTAIFMTVDWRG